MRLLSRRSLVAVVALAATTLAPACGRDAPREAPPRAEGRAPPPTTTTAPPPMAALPEGATIADVAARVTPSVVTVFSEREVAQPVDPFAELFGLPQQEPHALRERGLGSGVIVDAGGLVITNHHVVAQADQIQVALPDGRELKATVVGSDPKSDVALLRVEAQDLPAVEMADSSRLRIGDVVLAIGNPFGIGQTVTMGIISAVGRANMGLTDYEDFIQTDAAINPGNSGGALVDMAGRLVGINTAIVSRSGGSAGIGFAIPSSMVVGIKDELLEHGRVIRGWMGVALQDIDAELARAMELPERRGVLVTEVERGGPADEAGLRRGDLVTAIDGAPVTSSAQLRNVVAMAGKGARVRLDVLRKGAEEKIEVVLDELPDERGLGSAGPADTGPLAGIAVDDLDRGTRRQLGLPNDVQGVVVTRAPARAALRPGDVIMEVDRKPTPDVDKFREATAETGERVLLLIHRRGRTLFLLLSPR